jgi:hypothetical protein
LTEAQKAARVQKRRQLFAWHAGDVIIFFEEILFLTELPGLFSFVKEYSTRKIAVKSKTQATSTLHRSDSPAPSLNFLLENTL